VLDRPTGNPPLGGNTRLLKFRWGAWLWGLTNRWSCGSMASKRSSKNWSVLHAIDRRGATP
jgi:hypothetical protein